jgi:hypothetical protein
MPRDRSLLRRVRRGVVPGLVVVLLGGVCSGQALAATDSCPNAAVRAQQLATGLPSLPDCRAYEIVNPPSNDIGEANRVPFSADDGDTLAYLSVLPGDDSFGGGVSSMSVARRTASGWTSSSADPVSLGAIADSTGLTEPRGFSPDFSRALISTTLPAVPGDDDALPDFFNVEVGSGAATLMSQAMDSFSVVAMGATPNLDQLVLFKPGGQTPVPGIYRSDGAGLELLSVFPDNVTPFPPGLAQPAGGQFSRGLGVVGASIAPFVERNGAHAVSDDTRRVYFYGQFSGNQLYVRDLVSNPKRTVPVSVSSRAGDVGTLYESEFISASHSGSQAYFASNAQLTDAATPGGGIYRFDLASQTVTQITPDAGDPTGLHLGGAMASDDQSHVYFTSTSALAAGAQAGTGNAYVWTQAGGVRFIAAVDAADKFLRVTPDGRYALMLSGASIDGAPNNGHAAVYRYDYVADEVVCVSCRPDGSPSEGNANIEGQAYGQAAGPLARSRGMTLDGRVLFTSTDRLVRDDQTSAQDVYLYDKGTVSLLTAGRGDSNSYIGDMSDDGKNVTVVTRSALVGADRDAQEYDVYDVRAGGGFLEPLPPSDPCRGDDCQGPPAPTPVTPEPSSSRVTSAGNVPQAKVAKKLSVSKLTSAQRSTLARTGKVALTVRVTGGGTVSFRGRGRVAGSTRTVGSVSEAVLKKAQTTVKVTFRLSTAARREQTRLSGLPKTATTTINLTRAHR